MYIRNTSLCTIEENRYVKSQESKKLKRHIHSTYTGRQKGVIKTEDAPRHRPWILHWNQRQTDFAISEFENIKYLYASLILLFSPA